MKEAIIQYNDDPDSAGNFMVISWKEFVRCKDCVHWDELTQACDEIDGIFLPDWFCADGERRTDDA